MYMVLFWSLRPVFYTAFGCLAQGLAYMHARNLRHEDIKPNNIFYEQPLRNSNPTSPSLKNHDRFLWADFGLAYDFSDKTAKLGARSSIPNAMRNLR